MEDVASLLKASQSARKLLKTNPLIRIFFWLYFPAISGIRSSVDAARAEDCGK